MNLKPASIWILEKFNLLEEELENNLESYELAHSVDGLYSFLWQDYADWYVEYLKTDSSQVEFAKDLFKQFVISSSPYMPFEAQALWQEFFNESIPLDLVIKDPHWVIKIIKNNHLVGSADEFQEIIDFIKSLRSIRGLFGIDPAQYLEIYTDHKKLDEYNHFTKSAGRAVLNLETKPDLYTIKQKDFSYSIDILKYINDPQVELDRTHKNITALEKQIQALNNQLSNERFLTAADPKAVTQKKQDLKDRTQELVNQQSKLEFLS